MGSWAYCHECGRSVGPPTFREAMLMELECECGHVRYLDKHDKVQALEELEERIQALEQKIEWLDDSG